MKKYLEVGRIVGTHGVRGELRVQPWADDGEFLLDFDVLYYDNGAEKIEIEKARVHNNLVILKLKGVDTIEQADALRGRILYIDRSDARLPEGRYFIQDLIGLKVIDADNGEELGTIKDVFTMVANDVYSVITPDGRECLIPAIDDVLAGTDIEAGTVAIHKMKGMFDDED